MTNTANTPVEAIEAELALRVRRYALRRGSGGAGRWSGGDGIDRVVELLVDADVTLLAQRRVLPPWGLDGGAPGACGEDRVLVDGEQHVLAPEGSSQVRAGGFVQIRTPGGGGLGPPSPER